MNARENEIWTRARLLLREEIGKAAWGRWIEPVRFMGVAAGEARLAAQSGFAADWVNRHYAKEIVSALNEAGARCDRIGVSANAAANGAVEERTALSVAAARTDKTDGRDAFHPRPSRSGHPRLHESRTARWRPPCCGQSFGCLFSGCHPR